MKPEYRAVPPSYTLIKGRVVETLGYLVDINSEELRKNNQNTA